MQRRRAAHHPAGAVTHSDAFHQRAGRSFPRFGISSEGSDTARRTLTPGALAFNQAFLSRAGTIRTLLWDFIRVQRLRAAHHSIVSMGWHSSPSVDCARMPLRRLWRHHPQAGAVPTAASNLPPSAVGAIATGRVKQQFRHSLAGRLRGCWRSSTLPVAHRYDPFPLLWNFIKSATASCSAPQHAACGGAHLASTAR